MKTYLGTNINDYNAFMFNVKSLKDEQGKHF